MLTNNSEEKTLKKQLHQPVNTFIENNSSDQYGKFESWEVTDHDVVIFRYVDEELESSARPVALVRADR